MKIILASKSPRRFELLKKHNIMPKVLPSSFEESLPFEMTPEETTMYFAFQKANNVAQKIVDNKTPVVGADTVVVYNNQLLGKPKDKEDAFRMLKSLNNKSHTVITGVSLILPYKNIKKCFYESTIVHFNSYSDEELNSYLETDEAYDKAGAYGIQGTFSKYVSHIEGNMDNVIGFPVLSFLSELNKIEKIK